MDVHHIGGHDCNPHHVGPVLPPPRELSQAARTLMTPTCTSGDLPSSQRVLHQRIELQSWLQQWRHTVAGTRQDSGHLSPCNNVACELNTNVCVISYTYCAIVGPTMLLLSSRLIPNEKQRNKSYIECCIVYF